MPAETAREAGLEVEVGAGGAVGAGAAGAAGGRSDALGFLLSPLSRAEFFDSYWGQAPFIAHRGEPAYYRRLFTLDDFDRALAAAKGNARVTLSLIGAAGSDRGSVEGQVDETSHDLAFKRFAQGDTLRLAGVDSVWPPLGELCLDLGESLSAEIHANAYLTPAGAQGFRVHFDFYDVLVLQVAGAKEWSVYAPERRMPINLEFARVWSPRPESEEKLRLLERAELRAGDVLYMPRGFYHQAVAAADASLHLTLSINPLYWVQLVQKAVELMTVELDELRRALPPGWLEAAAAGGQPPDGLRALFLALAERADLEAAARALLERRFAGIVHPPDGQFAALARARELRPESRVSRRSGIPCAAGRAGDKAFIRIASNRVQGPAAILPALEFIAARRRFRVAELPGGLSDGSKVVLVRRLLEEGLLRIDET
jgi:ribosomal protein L16 Arg81 hydroxylase